MFGKIVGLLGLIWVFIWFVDGDTYVATAVTIGTLGAGIVLCGIAAMLVGSEWLSDVLGGKVEEAPPGEEDDEG